MAGQEITTVGLDEIVIHLRRAMTVFGGETYRTVLQALPQDLVRADRSALLYP